MPDAPNPIRAFLNELEEQRKRDTLAYHTPPPPPPLEEPSTQYALQWQKSALPPLDEPQPLADVREGITRAIMDYAQGGKHNPLLLVRVPPGTGKTTAAVSAAQDLSRSGRVLYAGPRHSFYSDVCLTRNFKPSLWYEWLPYAHQDEDGNHDMCRYAPQMMAWLERGYPAIPLCKGLCIYDGWINECPYRAQAKRKERIIFGMHEHLHTGMAISDYHLAICDEMPLGAFLSRRWIPTSHVVAPGASGAVGELFFRLEHLTQWAKAPVWGPSLFRYIGDVLADVYAEIEVLDSKLPQLPEVNSPEDVDRAGYWYIFDLLKLLSPEYECWRNGWQDWVSRVQVSTNGILMLSRHEPHKAWRGDHPGPVVCCDATGSAEMYQRIFGRDVIEYAPPVKRPGRVFQVVGRLNGMGTTIDRTVDQSKRKLTSNGIEMLKSADLIAKQYKGRKAVVTFKAAEPEFKAVFGDRNVRHYGDIRGTNDFESADVLFICGGYCPSMSGVLDMAAALHPRRMAPFVKRDENGNVKPLWSRRLVEYRMREQEGLAPFRHVSGFWTDPDLNVVLQEFRRNELTQAIHRVRPNIQKTDVWVLTSIPTDEPLDAIYTDISELDCTPSRKRIEKTAKGSGRTYPTWEGITWQKWLLLYKWLTAQWDAGVDYLTKEQIAEQAQVEPKTVVTQKWMDAIVEFSQTLNPHEWAKIPLKVDGASRRTWVISPVNH